MQWRITILLVVIAALGVLAVVFLVQPGQFKTNRTQTRTLLGQRVPINEVDRIHVAFDKDQEFTFERHEGQWIQVDPFRYPMKPDSMRRFAQLAAELDVLYELPAKTVTDEERQQMGLLPPRATLSLGWGDRDLTLLLGENPFAGRAYVQLAGDDKVHVVNQDLHKHIFDQHPNNWRTRNIFDRVDIDVDYIDRIDEGQRTKLERSDRGWQLALPVQSQVDRSTLESFVQSLSEMRAAGFALDQPTEKDLSLFGLDTPLTQLEISWSEIQEENGQIIRIPHSQILLVGAGVGDGSLDRYGMILGRPVVLRLSESSLRGILLPPPYFARRTGTGIPGSDITAIEIDTQDAKFRIDRRINLTTGAVEWFDVDQSDHRASLELVNELINQLSQVKASEIHIVAAEGVSEFVVGNVILYSVGARPVDTVRLLSLPDNNGDIHWAMENYDGVLRILPSSVNLLVSPESLGLPKPLSP